MFEQQPAQRAEATQPVPARSSTRRRVVVQRKLTVGSADDPLEAEADRVADDVMRILRNVSAARSDGGSARVRR